MIYQVDYRTRKLLPETGIPVFYASQIAPYTFRLMDEAGTHRMGAKENEYKCFIFKLKEAPLRL